MTEWAAIVVNFTPCLSSQYPSVHVPGQSISFCLIKVSAAQIIQQRFTLHWSAAMKDESLDYPATEPRQQHPLQPLCNPSDTSLTQCLNNLRARQTFKDASTVHDPSLMKSSNSYSTVRFCVVFCADSRLSVMSCDKKLNLFSCMRCEIMNKSFLRPQWCR